MCRDHRCLTTCQKQHRQNEAVGQVDIPTRVEVRVMGHPGHMKGPQMSHHLSKTTQTEGTSWSGRHSYQGGGPCDGGSWTYVGTTDVSPPVKNNTDRMNQLVRKTFLLEWRSVWWGIADMYRDNRHLIAFQKQYRQNEPAGWVEVPTGVDVHLMANPRHM